MTHRTRLAQAVQATVSPETDPGALAAPPIDMECFDAGDLAMAYLLCIAMGIRGLQERVSPSTSA